MCLFASLKTVKHVTGLWSAVIDCDHGLKDHTRVYYARGYWSEASAKAAGISLANALGRAVVAAGLALAIGISAGAMLAHDHAKANPVPVSSPRPLAVLEIDGTAWRCSSVADCAELIRRMGCSLIMQDGNSALLECDPESYRRAIDRHRA